MNNMLVQDKMWEDITASICDDFVTIKTEPTHQQNTRYQPNTNSLESSHALQQQHQQSLHHSYMRHSSNLQSSSSSIYGNIINTSPFNNNVMSTNLTNMPSVHHTNRVLLYLPPTPPNSEPGSPSTQQQQQQQQRQQQQQQQQQQHSHQHHQQPPHQPQRRTPPPPYTCGNNPNGPLHHQMPAMPPTMHLNGRVSVSHHQQQVSQQSGVSTPSLPQQRYNRRNNPELEKRRIHRCDYPGLQISLICASFNVRVSGSLVAKHPLIFRLPVSC